MYVAWLSSGHWTSWGEWTHCAASAAMVTGGDPCSSVNGTRLRFRTCLGLGGCDGGGHYQEEECSFAEEGSFVRTCGGGGERVI